MSAEDNGQGSRDLVSLSDAFQMPSCFQHASALATQASPAHHLMFLHTVAKARGTLAHLISAPSHGIGCPQCKVAPSLPGRASEAWPPLRKAPMLILLFAVNPPRRRLHPFRKVRRSTIPSSGGAESDECPRPEPVSDSNPAFWTQGN